MIDFISAQNNIVVTGMGSICSLGQGIPVLTDGLKTGRRNFALCHDFPEISFPIIMAENEKYTIEHLFSSFSNEQPKIKEKAITAGRRAPVVIQQSLIAAFEAWQQSKMAERTIDPTRIALVVAGQNTTQRYQYDTQKTYQDNLSYLTPRYALHFMDSDQVGTLSEVFEIKGEGFVVGGASASGNIGLIQACRLIQHGIADVCLAIGSMADLSPFELQGFMNIGALGGRSFVAEPHKASRPFDQSREGFIWGQASGCLILEAAHIAKRDNIIALAEIAGAGITLDANRQSEPNSDGETRAMRLALVQANLKPNAIQYINTHGSSSLKGDQAEVEAICEVFHDTCDDIWINATKGILGHCLWSAGIIEVIATILQMQHHFVHPNVNLDVPINHALRFVGQAAEIANIYVALSNSFGFGGINSSIVIKNGGK